MITLPLLSRCNRLVSTPALSGWNWDTVMFADANTPKERTAVNEALDRAVEQSPDIYLKVFTRDTRSTPSSSLSESNSPKATVARPATTRGRHCAQRLKKQQLAKQPARLARRLASVRHGGRY